MSALARRQLTGIVIAGALLSIAAISPSGPWLAGPVQAADDKSVDAIVQSLKTRRTRSAQPSNAPAVGKEIEALKQIRKTRGWNMHDRARVAEVARDLPQLDLVVYFSFDSADISEQAQPTLNKLGEALSQKEFQGQSFVIAGHSDAKGTAEYNQRLSERRAESVRNYIVKRYKLPAEVLMTAGYGFEQLKNPKNPFSGENRRVQVVNFGQ
jgi:outer membrane protein OmpA-like peptidoglycan-associated protein